MNNEMKNMEVMDNELETATGGNDGMGPNGNKGHVAGLTDGYLAVRSSARPGADNQIGGLLNGASVTLTGDHQNGYTQITAYCGKTAWTNETGWQTGWADSRFIVMG